MDTNLFVQCNSQKWPFLIMCLVVFIIKARCKWTLVLPVGWPRLWGRHGPDACSVGREEDPLSVPRSADRLRCLSVSLHGARTLRYAHPRFVGFSSHLDHGANNYRMCCCCIDEWGVWRRFRYSTWGRHIGQRRKLHTFRGGGGSLRQGRSVHSDVHVVLL